ncbi:MAG: tyrosine-type recombinase/integrase [Desulfovibrio sp.]|nr:tyrosine-type recombinase/integrase [Desulfovibrio sp.]
MLTEKAIAQARPREKVYRLSDQTGNGLCLEVSPSGGKHWRFRYRHQGKAKMISLGAYPAITLREAREKALAARKDVEKGAEPSGKKRKAGGGETSLFRDVAKAWWDRAAGVMTEKYASEVWGRLDRDALPFLGGMPLADIDAPTVLAVLRRVEERGTIVAMRKLKSHISQIMRYGIACGIIYHDPSRDLSGALRSQKSVPMPAIIEPKQVGKLMLAIRGYSGVVTRCALLLGALTFVRPGELRRAEWAEFDLAGAEWRIPGEKMKMRRPHIVPLATQSLAVLAELEKYTLGGRFLFPSRRTASRPMSDNTINAALRYLGYAREEMCGHGFRAMASSLLAEQGWSIDAIERQLAHVEGNKVRAAYHRSEHLEERRRMMQAWADYLDSLEASAGRGV